jgi:signal transduction histidine kinase
MLETTEDNIAQQPLDARCSDVAHTARVAMLGQLASALAHELSQPLAAILRNAEAAEIMLRSATPDLTELRAIVADIHRDDRRASAVIERLRALLKRRQLDFQPIAVDELVQETSSLVRSGAAARRIALETMIPANLPRISGDRVHLSQVLLNLLLNGVDAAAALDRPGRSVTVTARVTATRSIEVAVTDSGPGISAPLLGRLFEPYFTTKPDGMGMGLAVSRMIVEAHGGRLWAENHEGAGATFRFTIPQAEGCDE